MKPERTVNAELLETVRNLPCMACANSDPLGAYEAIHDHGIRCHPHHIITRKAGGNDVAENLLPLCFEHHREVHRIGLASFADKYKTVRDWLIAAKWMQDAPRIWAPPAGISCLLTEASTATPV